MSRLIVFDFDGTLSDSSQVIPRLIQAAYDACDLPAPSDQSILEIVGLSLPEAFASLSPELGNGKIPELIAAFLSFADKCRAQGGVGTSELFDGARQVLNILSESGQYKLGVATGKDMRGLGFELDHHGLRDYFCTLQTGCKHPSKPDPAMLRQALVESSSLAEQAIMIGDTSFDMEMGKAADMQTIAVTWGYHSAERLADCRPDVMIDHFDHLPGTIETLLR